VCSGAHGSNVHAMFTDPSESDWDVEDPSGLDTPAAGAAHRLVLPCPSPFGDRADLAYVVGGLRSVAA
jgi:hypothetical protein